MSSGGVGSRLRTSMPSNLTGAPGMGLGLPPGLKGAPDSGIGASVIVVVIFSEKGFKGNDYYNYAWKKGVIVDGWVRIWRRGQVLSTYGVGELQPSNSVVGASNNPTLEIGTRKGLEPPTTSPLMITKQLQTWSTVQIRICLDVSEAHQGRVNAHQHHGRTLQWTLCAR